MKNEAHGEHHARGQYLGLCFLTSINAGTIALPGGAISFGPRSDNIFSSVEGFGDLYPQFALRWNAGVHNYMAYITGDIPVGTYSSTRLANIGIGHGAIDGGGGYTYFNPQTGHEFSAVLGMTYNSRLRIRNIKAASIFTSTWRRRNF
jgi:hypothetical protein